MGKRYEDDPDAPPVGITCPSLDDLADLVKHAVRDPADRSEGLALIETIRTQNRGLRANAETWRAHARKLRRLLLERDGLTPGAGVE